MNLLQKLRKARKVMVQLLIGALFLITSAYLLDIWNASRIVLLPDYDYLADVIHLRDAGQTGDALAIAKFVESEPGMPHWSEIVTIGHSIEEKNRSLLGRAGRFASGFFTGNMESTEGAVGTVISDFLFIGDVRDLSTQGYRAITGEEYDKVVLTLSGVGVIATAASWAPVPEPGSKTAGITARPILTTLKALKRINALTSRFTRTLLDLGTEVVKVKKLGRFTGVLTDMGVLMKHAPAGTLATATRRVETLDDLHDLARWTRASPEKTITALHVGGDEAVRWLKGSTESIDRQLGLVLRKGLKGFSHTGKYTRGAKFLYRGRMDQIRESLVNWLVQHANLRPFILGTGILAIILALCYFFSPAREIVRLFRQLQGRLNPLPLKS